jgi:hypothetical protein
MGNCILRKCLSYSNIGYHIELNNDSDMNNNECLICWETNNNDDQDVVICLRCKIKIHKVCEDKYRGNKDYCKCPHCQQRGSLGIYS